MTGMGSPEFQEKRVGHGSEQERWYLVPQNTGIQVIVEVEIVADAAVGQEGEVDLPESGVGHVLGAWHV